MENYIVVQGLLPNANESAVINVLTNGQFEAITLENTTLPDDFLLPPEPVPENIGLPPLRGKRQSETGLSCDTLSHDISALRKHFHLSYSYLKFLHKLSWRKW